MSVKLFICECGSTMFYNTVPHQFEEKDINNWNTFGLKAYAGLALVLICLACEKVHVPPANFSGKSRLDPNVVAYGELLNAIETRNAMLSSVGSLEEQVNQLQEELGEAGCKCPSLMSDNDGDFVAKLHFNHPSEEEEYMAKLDKQTNPSKDELSLNNKGSKAPKSNEPNNKDGKTVTKVKKIKKPTKKSMQEKTVDGPN